MTRLTLTPRTRISALASTRVLVLASALVSALVVATLLAPLPANAASGVGPGTYEDSSPAITYQGAWTRQASTGSSGESIRYSTSTSASASLTFTGPSITWYTWKSRTAGKVGVYIDGVLRATVDNYAAGTSTMVRGYSAHDLPAGTHTITLRATGSSNASSTGTITHLDSFVVGKPPAAAPSAPRVRASDCPTATVHVSNSQELSDALSSAGPGTVIRLAPGKYQKGFRLTRSGTDRAPIWVCGPRSAIVQGVAVDSGTAFRIDDADHVRLAGFTVNKALQGVMVKFSSHVSVADLNVKDVGYEGIHLYAFTTDSQVIGNLIERTGALNASYGEGIYIGTSQRRWAAVTGGRPDASDRNVIAGNTVVSAGAEPIEAKEGTTGGVIRGNVLTGHRQSSRALAWVLVTGNDWKVTGNSGSGAVQHGYASMIWDAWGQRNDFRRNTGAVNAPGYAVWKQQTSSATAVSCDNVATGAQAGQTNVFCTP